MVRHPTITERLAENMDAARVSMSTREVVDGFYDLFHDTLLQHDLVDKPERVRVFYIYNMIM